MRTRRKDDMFQVVPSHANSNQRVHADQYDREKVEDAEVGTRHRLPSTTKGEGRQHRRPSRTGTTRLDADEPIKRKASISKDLNIRARHQGTRSGGGGNLYARQGGFVKHGDGP